MAAGGVVRIGVCVVPHGNDLPDGASGAAARVGRIRTYAVREGAAGSLRTRVQAKSGGELFPAFRKEPLASQGLGVEAVLAAFLLGRADAPGAATRAAFDRMWSVQMSDGNGKGGWKWFELDLDPWETTDSPFYGAALAAMAACETPAEYRERPAIRERMESLAGYLRERQTTQPLHNRALLLWTAGKFPAALSDTSRKALVDAIFKAQQADGSWTAESAGPWKPHTSAPASKGSDAYITAFFTASLEEGGVTGRDPRLVRAQEWLSTHQNPQYGYWEATSMNKVYPPGSMQVQFMRDAATAFASLALSHPKSESR